MAYPASFKLVLLGVLFDADSWFEYHFFRIRPKSIVCIYYFHQITSTKRSCWQAQHYFSSFLENCWADFISWYIFSRLCTPWINQDDCISRTESRSGLYYIRHQKKEEEESSRRASGYRGFLVKRISYVDTSMYLVLVYYISTPCFTQNQQRFSSNWNLIKVNLFSKNSYESDICLIGYLICFRVCQMCQNLKISISAVKFPLSGLSWI